MYADSADNRDDVDPAKQQEAIAEIDSILKTAEADYKAALKKVEELADKFDIRVSIDAAGVGLTYEPKLPKDWDGSSCSDYGYTNRGEWNSSSNYC